MAVQKEGTVKRGHPPQNIPELKELKEMDPEARRLSAFGVDYAHIKTSNKGDLYLTEWGWPMRDLLDPSAWDKRENFKRDRQLAGSSMVYRITADAGERQRDFVLKWNRVGQDVDVEKPPELDDVIKTDRDDIASPFEEFGLVMELRRNEWGSPDIRILMQKPMAIYSPPHKIVPEQFGRKNWKFNHQDRLLKEDQAGRGGDERANIDLDRHYAVLYEWVKGDNAGDAFTKMGMTDERRQEMRALVGKVIRDMEKKGMAVTDTKANHIIVRTRKDGSLLRDKKGDIAYVHVDNELMDRTAEYRTSFRLKRREEFFRHLEHRDDEGLTLPSNLGGAQIMDLPFIAGATPSTGGYLWILGRNPALFDYYQPERWEQTPKVKIATRHDLYKTRSKDGIYLVWGVSKVGEKPMNYDNEPRADEIMKHGFNSPWEEFKIAFDLKSKGMLAVNPRAIYIPGQEIAMPDYYEDTSRLESHNGLRTPHGGRILETGKKPVIIYGFWRGMDPLIGRADGRHWGQIDLEMAKMNGVLTNDGFDHTLGNARAGLHELGIDPKNFTPDTMQMMFGPQGRLDTDRDSEPKVTLTMNAFGAHKFGLLPDKQFDGLLKRESKKLAEAGYDHLTSLDNHLLVRYTLGQGMINAEDGLPEATHCVFDLYKKKG